MKNVLAMYNCSYFINEISEELEISLKNILNILENHVAGFQYNGAKTFSQSHIKKILIEYVDYGISSKVIAKKYGHCYKTILKILHENKIALRPKGTQKIFEDDEPIILKMYLENIPTKTIAAHFNVSSGAIIRLLHKNEVEIKEYQPTIESRQDHRKYTCNVNYFSILDTADKVYFLGLFASDGGFLKKAVTGDLIGISIGLKASSYRILESFLFHIESTDILRLDSRIYTYKGRTRILYQNKAVVYSKIFAEFVRIQLELPQSFNKTFDIIYPSTIPLEFARHFCRGIFCGDGTIDTYSNKIVFYGTKSLLEGIRKVICNHCAVSFIELKPKVTKTSKSEDHLYELAWSGKRQILAILDWLYIDTNLYIEEKYLKYKSLDREKAIINITDLISIEDIVDKRKKLGMSQLALARATACSGAVISDLERNIRTTMTTSIAKKLLEVLSIDYDPNVFLYSIDQYDQLNI
ncbi:MULTISPECIES: helix-turn-helix transcriptional regulator [unclassified Mesobacillus]|uniref:helix-turn-helix domain-containing protein n=1 Tax=unclassified Mesobacillus TaxID=2675270 RepID=UPI00203E9F50|nr:MULTISPECIES: helix-turn-helix transcriptional regulator [unclassified Mesobacillus]MCM3125833.1 helix-turn-helix transcriptional regulator [Mesobacillus sp. MER 33]MCM3235854.1 helix-turn-helix transcriptional regulator [Mesobacillus sp. MER 48]